MQITMYVTPDPRGWEHYTVGSAGVESIKVDSEAVVHIKTNEKTIIYTGVPYKLVKNDKPGKEKAL